MKWTIVDNNSRKQFFESTNESVEVGYSSCLYYHYKYGRINLQVTDDIRTDWE